MIRRIANQLRVQSHVPPWCIRISPLNRARKVESTGRGEHAGGTSSSTQRFMRSLMGADCLALASAVAVHTARAFTMYGCASTTIRASWTGVSTCIHLCNCYELVQITISGEYPDISASSDCSYAQTVTWPRPWLCTPPGHSPCTGGRPPQYPLLGQASAPARHALAF